MKAIWSEKGMPSDSGLQLRAEVFMDEQGFSRDTDETDAVSWHLVLYENGTAVGAARLFSEDGRTAHLGRIVVRKTARGQGLGLVLLHEMEKKAKELGFSRAELGGQVRAAGFYEKAGYSRFGEEFFDEYCPHVMMGKTL